MSLVLIAAISSSIALVTVTGRFACRYHYASKFGIDDWVIAGSMVTISNAPIRLGQLTFDIALGNRFYRSDNFG